MAVPGRAAGSKTDLGARRRRRDSPAGRVLSRQPQRSHRHALRPGRGRRPLCGGQRAQGMARGEGEGRRHPAVRQDPRFTRGGHRRLRRARLLGAEQLGSFMGSGRVRPPAVRRLAEKWPRRLGRPSRRADAAWRAVVGRTDHGIGVPILEDPGRAPPAPASRPHSSGRAPAVERRVRHVRRGPRHDLRGGFSQGHEVVEEEAAAVVRGRRARLAERRDPTRRRGLPCVVDGTGDLSAGVPVAHRVLGHDQRGPAPCFERTATRLGGQRAHRLHA